jgi:hypothetical protein
MRVPGASVAWPAVGQVTHFPYSNTYSERYCTKCKTLVLTLPMVCHGHLVRWGAKNQHTGPRANKFSHAARAGIQGEDRFDPGEPGLQGRLQVARPR